MWFPISVTTNAWFVRIGKLNSKACFHNKQLSSPSSCTLGEAEAPYRPARHPVIAVEEVAAAGRRGRRLRLGWPPLLLEMREGERSAEVGVERECVVPYMVLRTSSN